MSRYAHIPIFQKTYQLTLAVYKAADHFKKAHKYTLGDKLKNICGELLDLIVVVNKAEDKKISLEQLDIKLETLRIHLRLAFDLKTISPGLLGELNKAIEEIGRQIGGLKRWAENKNSEH